MVLAEYLSFLATTVSGLKIRGNVRKGSFGEGELERFIGVFSQECTEHVDDGLSIAW